MLYLSDTLAAGINPYLNIKDYGQVEKFMLSNWFNTGPYKRLDQVDKIMSSYWFISLYGRTISTKIVYFFLKGNGVDMLHPYILYLCGRGAGGFLFV